MTEAPPQKSLSLKQILQLIEQKGFVKTDKSGHKHITKKWYDVTGDPPTVRPIEELSDKYRLLWPAGVKSGNFYVRSGTSSIQDKMRKFVAKFPQYSDETILAATQRYVEECARERYQYMKLAEYFIFKNDSSQLETYCELIDKNETASMPAKRKLRTL